MDGYALVPYGSDGKAAEKFCERFGEAKARRDLYASLVDRCYTFALPLRQRATMLGHSGPPDTDELFDSTMITAIQDFASEVVDDVWPVDQTPFELRPGADMDPSKINMEEMVAAISEWRDAIVSETNNSNFRSAGHEAALDYAIGMGFLTQNAGNALKPLTFNAIPLTEAVADIGPDGSVDFLGRERKVRAAHIEALWPRARIPAELRQIINDHPRREVEVIEGEERDWSKWATENLEAWVVRVVWRGGPGGKTMLVEERNEGIGSCSFVAPSFSRASGETMGRGPVMMMLGDTKVTNKLRELMLEHADLQLSGIWLADDDGVLNPDTARLEPGTLIPRAVGSKGLENIAPAGDMRLGEMLKDDLRAQIREGMYVNDLGNLQRTPRSATEIMQRTADRARRRSGAYARLMTEWLQPQVARSWWLLKRARGKTGLASIDGRRVVVRALGPITRAQAQDDVLRHLRWIEIMQQTLGNPMAPMMLMDPDKWARWLAEAVGFNPTLLRSSAEVKKLMGAAVAQMQMGQAQGQAIAAPPV